jgi:hypothetical protein
MPTKKLIMSHGAATIHVCSLPRSSAATAGSSDYKYEIQLTHVTSFQVLDASLKLQAHEKILTPKVSVVYIDTVLPEISSVIFKTMRTFANITLSFHAYAPDYFFTDPFFPSAAT